MINQNNTRPVETILLAETVEAATTTVKLVDASGVNLNDKQIGIFSASALNATPLNDSIPMTAAGADFKDPIIQIVQGTANSSFTRGAHPLVDNRPYVTSGPIDLRNDTIITSRKAKEEEFSTWIIGKRKAASSAVGEINIADDADYSVSIALMGQVLDLENSMHGKLATTISYRTPDFDDLGIVDQAAKDVIVQNFVYKINRNSRAFFGGSIWGGNLPMLAFAVAKGTLAASTNIDTVNINDTSFNNGGSVDMFKRNGVTYSVNLTANQVASLRKAIVTAERIVVVDLDVAMTNGATEIANHFVVMALDRDLAYEDRAPLTKIRLDLGLPRGFTNSVNKEEKVLAFEGEGKGRVWDIFYTNTAGQRIYSQYQRQEFPFIDVPSGIDLNANYDVIIIEHRSYAEIDLATTSVAPKRTYILGTEDVFNDEIPAAGGNPAVSAGACNALITYLNSAIDKFSRVSGMKDGVGTTDLI